MLILHVPKRSAEENERERQEALDPRWRYWAGFDRWNFEALSKREVIVADSNSLTVALDLSGSVWFWHFQWELWLGIPEWYEVQVKAENNHYVQAMKKSVPIIHLMTRTTVEGERSAAQNALSRLAASVREFFRLSPTGGASRCWVGAASIYHSTTKSNRWQIPQLVAPPFDADVHAWLEASERAALNKFCLRDLEGGDRSG